MGPAARHFLDNTIRKVRDKHKKFVLGAAMMRTDLWSRKPGTPMQVGCKQLKAALLAEEL